MMKLETHTLGEICDKAGGFIRTGPFGSQLHESDYVEQGIPVVMPKNIIDGKVLTEDIALIHEEDAQRLSTHRLKQGDIVYGRRGDIGRHAIVTRREAGWLCGTGCLRISQVNRILEPLFLHYYLSQQEIITWIANHAIGATLPNLNTSILRSVPIVYPPLPIQRTIATILSAYDDLIENNTRRIAILEEMAQMLYQEWFVKFRFPGHEQATMVESEMGMIPEGWEAVQFIDIADVLSGGTPKTTVAEYWNGDIPFYTPKDAPDSFFAITTEKSITVSGLNSCSSKLYPKNTVFITARGTVGKVALNAYDMAMKQSCYALKGRGSMGQLFTFMHISNCIRRLKQTANGAVFDTIIV
ncbi:MAG: restriction endonuclease subunit S, partial [Chloroflexota bacterium]|nr:restriction endonuclease subunit S [Chloroflexota bacterium]